MKHFDVIVIGGGASGMMAAGRAAESGRRVLLLEKNASLGEKLSITGGGRCNITNAEFDTRALLAHFGEAGKFLFSPFSKFAVEDTFSFFEERGLPLVVEERKRAFPKTQKAPDVTRVMAEYVREQGVTVTCNAEVRRLQLADGQATVDTDGGSFTAESLVLATGGASYQETGSTGDGLRWLEGTGHTVCEATPDLVPLKVQEPWVKALSGTSLEPMTLTFRGRNGDRLQRTGRLLFTHFGISGPLVLNSAFAVKNLLKHGPVAVTLDVSPGRDAPEVEREVLRIFAEHSNKLVRNVLKPLVPAGFSAALLNHLPANLADQTVNQVTVEQRRALVTALKSLPFTVTGTMGYDWAVVCDGGIDLHEIDTRTMRSRVHDNLFVVGDLLHINRPSGGYSLQLCWTTGWVAGLNA